MPIWDFCCVNEECEHVVMDRFMTPGRDVPVHCGKKMMKMPASGAFVVKGFSQQNGYSGGQSKEVKVKDKHVKVVVNS